MIISRAPLRISFMGGGTDLKDFYSRYPGRVISTTIDKFVYIVVNPGTLLNQFIIKYTQTETVKHPRDFKHNLFREALLKMNIAQSLEIASFAELPSRTGLGSSSSFSVALFKALHSFLGSSISKKEAAELASELEIEILKDPIGKQDHYAAAFGGFNFFQFNPNGSVEVEHVFLDFQARSNLEKHLLLYYMGITRSAGSVLTDQRSKLDGNFEIYKKMSDSVPQFRHKLMAGDLKGMAAMLHEGWLMKKSLSQKISTPEIDQLYEAGIAAGAWGGKVLGAGGGGCLLFMAEPDKHGEILAALDQKSASLNLQDYCRIPIKLTQSGADILFNSTAA